jgi:hypothetical protein
VVRSIWRFIAGAALVSAAVSTAAQGGLKTINPPAGGTIVYGQVDGQTTEAGAMGVVLHSLHQSLGEKPQVGKLFQVRGTESVAVFFSVTRHDQGPGKPPLQVDGLLIATKVSTDHVEAALVSDEASRFPKTLPGMMKTLMGVWHPLKSESAASATTGGGGSGAVAPLKQVVLQDRSASISLPQEWQLSPSASAMGTIVASGPNGEIVSLGLTFLAADTNNPHVQQTMRTVQAGGLRNTVYATALYYPYGADPGKTFVDVLHHAQQRNGMQPADYHLNSVTAGQSGPRQRCFNIEGTADFHDGKGTRELNALFCVSPPGPMGTWMSSVYASSAPLAVAAKERATLSAILQSFSVNQAVVAQQANQIAAPQIAQIHAIGQRAAAQAQSAHQAEDIHNSSVYQHWDSMDKRSQEFENYQLGYTVISDSQNNAHGTFWNQDADALVKSNPDRFEYVNAPNYWKGIDY